MTRFARAQGSKSSNERVPEEATSWAEMKQQLAVNNVEVDDSKKKEFLDLREKNYKNFLSENASKQENAWADFGDVATPDFIPFTSGKSTINGVVEAANSKPKKSKKKGKVEDVNSKPIKTKKAQECETNGDLDNVKLEVNEPDIKVRAMKKKIETSKAEEEEGSKVISSVVPNVEKVFESEKQRLFYEKKMARKLRQKEKIKQGRAILARNDDDNRLTQMFKDIHEKRKEKRRKRVLAMKEERERLKGSEQATVTNETTEALTNTQKRKKRKAKKAELALESTAVNGEDKVTVEPGEDEPEVTSKKKKKRNNSETARGNSSEINGAVSNPKKRKVSENTLVKKEKTKRKLSETDIAKDSLETQPDKSGTVKKKNLKNSKKRQRHKKRNIKAGVTEGSETKTAENSTNNNEDNSIGDQNEKIIQKNDKPLKEHKLKNAKWTGEHRKKPMGPEITTLRLNGRSIEMALFDGFPVKIADHERLTQLRKEMVSKGVPRSEVQRAMQLERRRAEKALAREKKEVCFHCRKAGHKLTECPDALQQETEATGICFKCGSTEHTHFECKVVQQQQFKFATCFICREPGHIAKQCPQNARGVYPDGGCCKVCGDVTHLKKDCPQYQAQQEHDAVQVDTIDGTNLEALDLEKDELKVQAAATPVKKTKVIKF